jgi:hypothetical protein
MAVKVLDGPIFLAGESLSEPLDCTAGQLIRIITPSNWVNSDHHKDPDLTFQVSNDGVTWKDLFDREGYEYNILTIIPDTAVVVSDQQVRRAWVRFRSGSRINPLPQVEECHYQVVLEEMDGSSGQSPADQNVIKRFVPTYGWSPVYGKVLLTSR